MADPGTDVERAALEAVVDRNRAALIDSVRRLDDAQSRRRLVPSATTPIGLLKHVAAVERFWFQHILAGRPFTECDGPAKAGRASFTVRSSDSLDDVITELHGAIEVSRTITADFALSDTVLNHHGAEVSVYSILLHMIEEVARHAGHADILVEQILADDPSSPR